MPDVFIHIPDHLTQTPSQPDHPQPPSRPRKLTIFYFITGNPGLINYYIPFLTSLVDEFGKDIIIAGASLAGFEDRSVTSPTPLRTASTEGEVEEVETSGERLPLFPDGFVRKDVYNLRDQVDVSYLRVRDLVRGLHALVARLNSAETHTNGIDKDDSSPISVDVMLAGHSVGAYIALEVVRRHHEESLTVSKSSKEEDSSPKSLKEVHNSKQQIPWSISATFLLTPTIQDISLSRSGRIATPVLSSLPGFPYLVQLGASSLTSTLPTTWLKGLVRRVTGMRDGRMVDATTEFLGRSGAVRQALYLASWEMAEIGEGRWTDAVWGATGADRGGVGVCDGDQTWRVPRHHFLFAKEDHWVADETREAIVRGLSGVAKIKVDEGEMGLVHAWCLDQSELVADIVGKWIAEVLQADKSTAMR